METLVQLDNVTRRFGNVAAIEDVSLDLRAGEILGLYGPSGSGKTTAIRLILGVHLPTSGTVRVLGVPSHEITARQRQQLGYSPQRFLYPPTLSAAQVVWFAAGLYGIGWLRGRKAVRGVLEKVDLWEKRGRLVDQMSGGERRRVGNAAALVHSPRLAFLDEPTAGLDPILRGQIWEWFKELRDEGRTLLVTGHYLAEAEICDRVALLVDGKLRALGTPLDLRRQVLHGDIIEVEIPGSLGAAIAALEDKDFVREVGIHGRNQLRVTVSEAQSALPMIIDALRWHGIDMRSATEVRPPFDEIFEQLVKSGV